MAEGSAGLHEPEDSLETGTIDRHRAMRSIMEELEAIDWYAQRVDAASDPALAAVLDLRTYLFTDTPITGIEAAAEAAGAGTSSGSLGIGSLRTEET